MKIAFVEWYPRICGVTEVTKHWVTGAKALGYQGDLVTFSKTGRPRGDWHDAAAWQTYRIADLPDVLNAYDLIVLSDIICQAPQVCGGRSKKNWVEPYFVEALKSVATPWTTMLHDGSYHSKHEDTIEKMLALKNFAGTVITSRPRMVKERFAKYLDRFKLVYYPYLPYDFSKYQPFAGSRRTKDFIMTSRIATTKGQNTALQLLPDLKGNVHVWGITAFGLPSLAWGMLWEFGCALGYNQVKKPVPAQRLLAKAKGPVHPNAHKFYTGAFEFRSGKRRYVYHDDFASQDTIDWSPWISLSLTNDSLQESLEVVTLDAVAKGAVAVVPSRQFQAGVGGRDYKTLFTLPYAGANWRVKDGKVIETRSDWDRPAIVEKLNWLLKQSDASLRDWQDSQRAELADRHHPKKVLKCLLEAL